MSVSEASTAVAGGLSGLATRIVSTPLDVLKIRFQLQLEPIKRHSTSKYHSVAQAVQTILREEGPRAMWKGFLPGLGLYVLYGSVQFSTYEYVLNFYQKVFKDASPSQANFIAGCVGGCVAMATCQPLDVLRTRLAAQGEPKVYKHILLAVRNMYTENGVRTFFKGLSPALVSTVPQIGLSFALYSRITRVWKKYIGSDNMASSFVCGASSGAISKLVVLPLDTVKRRLQVQGFEVARQSFGRVTLYEGVMDCAIKMIREEGPMAFYKGASVSVIKSFLAVGVTFSVYDQALHWFKDCQ